MDTAWMIRNDGKSFPVKVHLYVIEDEDMSSEAEVSSFLLSTGSSLNIDFHKDILLYWMCLLLEYNVMYDDDHFKIKEKLNVLLSSLPYHFSYPLPNSALISIFDESGIANVDDLYEKCDDCREHYSYLSNRVKQALNQQFMRSRFGGQYNTNSGNNSLWYRISSIGFNWANIIYEDASIKNKTLGAARITICRDYESDNGDSYSTKEEYFYKAKDGAVYYNMPIEEFLQEEHEHSLVFSKTGLDEGSGPLKYVKSSLALGKSIDHIFDEMKDKYYSDTEYDRVLTSIYLTERKSMCLGETEFMKTLSTRTSSKVQDIIKKVLDYYPYIDKLEMTQYSPREGKSGLYTGFEMTFKIYSKTYPEIDGLEIAVRFSKSFGAVPSFSVARAFIKEFEDYMTFKKMNLR